MKTINSIFTTSLLLVLLSQHLFATTEGSHTPTVYQNESIFAQENKYLPKKVIINNSNEKKLVSFIKDLFNDYEHLSFQKLSILEIKKINLEWTAVKVKIFMQDDRKKEGKYTIAENTFFYSGDFVTTTLFNINDSTNYSDLISKEKDSKLENKKSYLNSSFKYNNKNKVLGSDSNNNKANIIVFSDPYCPSCVYNVPKSISILEGFEDKANLYYYDFPLNIHPKAEILIRLKNKYLEMNKNAKLKDILSKIYSFRFNNKIDSIIIEEFNILFKTNYTRKDLFSKSLDKKYKYDYSIPTSLGIKYTPFFLLNGKESSLKEINTYLKEIK
jgi:hypothetical protein